MEMIKEPIFRKNLRIIRAKLGYSQVQMADLFDISQKGYSVLETKGKNFPERFIPALEAKGIDITAFLTNKGELFSKSETTPASLPDTTEQHNKDDPILSEREVGRLEGELKRAERDFDKLNDTISVAMKNTSDVMKQCSETMRDLKSAVEGLSKNMDTGANQKTGTDGI